MGYEQQVLNLLQQQNDYLSGQALAAALGVSRNTVWKAVDALRAQGYAIDSLTRRGYRLVDPPAVTAAMIDRALPKNHPFAVAVQPRVTSTNTVLKQQAAAGAPEGTVLAAHTQTAGRGRSGRSFYSPPGTGIYFSVLLRPTLPAAHSLLITAAAAVAVADALEKRGLAPGIKWVNDVFLNGRKVCGILTEAALSLETGGLEYAVLGIGLDLAPNPRLPAELTDVVGHIYPAPPPPEETAALVADVLSGFWKLYEDLRPQRFLEAYRRRCFVLGKPVTFQTPAGPVTATAEDVDEDFALLARASDGTRHRLRAGEVSIVPAV